jgi:hypothetical protein
MLPIISDLNQTDELIMHNTIHSLGLLHSSLYIKKHIKQKINDPTKLPIKYVQGWETFCILWAKMMLLLMITKEVGSGGNALDLYSGSAKFKSQLGHQLS